MDGLKLKPTERGTPQGGTISPLLANIALHGMENVIKELADSFDMRRVDGTQMSYFMTIGNKNWVFATRTRDNPFPTYLISHQDTEIKQFVKVKGDASPYDGNLVYWSTRQGKHPEMPTRTASLLKKHKGLVRI